MYYLYYKNNANVENEISVEKSTNDNDTTENTPKIISTTPNDPNAQSVQLVTPIQEKQSTASHQQTSSEINEKNEINELTNPIEPSRMNIEKIVEPEVTHEIHKTSDSDLSRPDNLIDNQKESEHNIKIDITNLFPELDINYLYSFIRIINNEPVITDDLISKAIKQIISGLSTTSGSVISYVKKVSPQLVFISID